MHILSALFSFGFLPHIGLEHGLDEQGAQQACQGGKEEQGKDEPDTQQDADGIDKAQAQSPGHIYDADEQRVAQQPPEGIVEPAEHGKQNA